MCSTICPIQRSTTQNAEVAYHYRIFTAAETLPKAWDSAAPEHNVFLQRAYLEVLAANPSENAEYHFVLFYKVDVPIGVAMFGSTKFQLGQSLHFDNDEKTPFFKKITNRAKAYLAKQVNIYALLCGNPLLTGENGYWFDNQEITTEEAHNLLEKATNKLCDLYKQKGKKISILFNKDFFEPNAFFIEKKFSTFGFQPNMTLFLRPEWKTFDDYLDAMSTKYRTRAKRASKKGNELRKLELDADMMRDNETRIYQLYRNVADSIEFNLAKLHPQYFHELKKSLGDKMRCFAYFHEGEMVAFFSTIENHEELEAHFLGLDYGKNQEYQVYLNILYDIAKVGIESPCNRIIYARTALEIKSSIGAEPVEMYTYLRHRNRLMNYFFKRGMEYFTPVEVWEQRKPFKEEGGK
ncbi:MAG: hypothetical protein RLZZ292_2815 [Bacteroidota bacterium]|jgi:predicted N-acyltransferase